MYFLINKPYNYLSQFTREAEHHKTLSDLYDFPKDVYPVGRLDRDSEGLLILTDDKRLNHKLLNPAFQHERRYWVQVEGEVSEEALSRLKGGTTIRIKGKEHKCAPVGARIIPPPDLPPRDPPVRYRKTVPDSWLELTLTEGKNRQVRRMCAAVGYPVLRLVRASIEGISLKDLGDNAVCEVAGEWLRPRLRL